MRLPVLALTVAISLTACTRPRQEAEPASAAMPPAGAPGAPLATRNMPAPAGQQPTCAGPRHKTFDLDVIETNVDLVRMYFVNIGPGTAAAHVIGSVLDRVYAGTPLVESVQTFPVAAGAGAILEFYIPEAGVFPFVDHDKLAFLPYGLSLAFTTPGVPGRAH